MEDGEKEAIRPMPILEAGVEVGATPGNASGTTPATGEATAGGALIAAPIPHRAVTKRLINPNTTTATTMKEAVRQLIGAMDVRLVF